MPLNLTHIAFPELGDTNYYTIAKSAVDVLDTNNRAMEAAIDLFSAGVGLLISAADTTVGYANVKLIAGTGITVTLTNPGGNETLVFATELNPTGTPVDNQIAVWTNATTLEGTTGLTYDGANLQLTGDIGSTGTRITKGWFTNLEVTSTATVGTLAATTINAATLAGTISCADNIIARPKFIDYGETVNALGDLGGGSDAINLESGNVVTATVSTGAQTFTFTNPPASGTAGSFTLILTNGGSQTVNWPASVDWVDGTAPVLTAAGVDVLVFTTTDAGTTWLGFVGGLDLQ